MNKQDKLQNTQTQTTVRWLPEEKSAGCSKGSQIYSDGISLDFGWWTQNAIYR